MQHSHPSDALKEWNAVALPWGYAYAGLAGADAEGGFHQFNRAAVVPRVGEPRHNRAAVGCGLSTFHMWKNVCFLYL